ncbi:phosphate uptake regulator PhoU [Natrinema sp. DC36]|uniref:PhoU domain-containing protein n=1 Tax=Natrinema sp. DC36 TaxID=2878680 RepID=UPI001CEFEB7E|nr:phosphate uptake regulator PhoU [Natrinema sp. DC36]
MSIPGEWAAENDIEAGNTVYLYTHLDGSLVVRRREKEQSELADIEAKLDNHDTSAMRRTFHAAYTAGFDRITLQASDQLTKDQQRAITAGARELTGVEIVEQTETSITAQVLLSSRDISVRQSLLRLRSIALSMHEAAMAAFAGETDEVEHIFQRDDEAGRVFQLIMRHFNRSLQDFEDLDQLDITRPQLFRYFFIAQQLERVADHAAKIADLVIQMETPIEDELLAEVVALGEDARQVVHSASDAVINTSSTESAHSALNLRDRVIERATDIDHALLDQTPDEAYIITQILDSLKRTAKCGGNIAEVALQNSIAPTVEQTHSTRQI